MAPDGRRGIDLILDLLKTQAAHVPTESEIAEQRGTSPTEIIPTWRLSKSVVIIPTQPIIIHTGVLHSATSDTKMPAHYYDSDPEEDPDEVQPIIPALESPRRRVQATSPVPKTATDGAASTAPTVDTRAATPPPHADAWHAAQPVKRAPHGADAGAAPTADATAADAITTVTAQTSARHSVHAAARSPSVVIPTTPAQARSPSVVIPATAMPQPQQDHPTERERKPRVHPRTSQTDDSVLMVPNAASHPSSSPAQPALDKLARASFTQRVASVKVTAVVSNLDKTALSQRAHRTSTATSDRQHQENGAKGNMGDAVDDSNGTVLEVRSTSEPVSSETAQTGHGGGNAGHTDGRIDTVVESGSTSEPVSSETAQTGHGGGNAGHMDGRTDTGLESGSTSEPVSSETAQTGHGGGNAGHMDGRIGTSSPTSATSLCRRNPDISPERVKQNRARKLRHMRLLDAQVRILTGRSRAKKRLQAVTKPKLTEVLAKTNPDDTAVASVLSRMCVLSASKIARYRRVYEDLVTSTCGAMTDDQLRNGIQTVCGSTVKKVELDFVIEVLDLLQEDGPFRSTGVNFEQFMMAGELSACVVNLTPEIRKKINCEDLAERKRKAIMMFFVDANEDCTLSLTDLGVLMDAGRIDPRQKEVVLGNFAKHGDSISLLEYLAHLPLFLDVHHDIVEHTLDGRRRLV
jgi:hypothetical protein